MGVIATLLPHSTRLQRLRAAIRDRHSIVACDDWSALTRMCDAEPIHLAVIDLYADGTANFESVRLLKLRFPRVALVAYVGVTPERARDMFDAGRCGFDGLIVADVDDAPLTLLAHVDKAEARSVASLLRRAIGDLKPTARDAVLASVTRAHERLTPDAFARMLAVPRRLLTRRLTDAGFPPPHRLLTWGRLIVAAHMLEDKHRSADSVAQVLDFPSGSAFRNTCQRYLRATPQQLRDRGGASYVIETFMSQARRAAAVPRRARPAGTAGVPAPTSPVAVLGGEPGAVDPAAPGASAEIGVIGLPPIHRTAVGV